jgi:hypothetical protein
MVLDNIKKDQSPTKEYRQLAQVVEKRVGRGPTEIVSGWQSVLKNLLEKVNSYLKPGAMVTFQSLTPREKDHFTVFSSRVKISPACAAIFIPPSVRQQMMGGWAGDNPGTEPSDAGVIIASRPGNFSIIINVLFAHPPFTPAVDVYENGQLSAGYQYDSIEACQSELGEILDRHLGSSPADA